jgi:hypothetical protein
MGNEYSNASYKLAADKRKDDGNRSRIVIEPAESEDKPVRPAQPTWKHNLPDVNDENSYDKNTITPEQMKESGWTKGKPEPVKQT